MHFGLAGEVLRNSHDASDFPQVRRSTVCLARRRLGRAEVRVAELAKELGYTGDSNDSATMNIWLHKQVLTKLAANGGKLPADLKI